MALRDIDAFAAAILRGRPFIETVQGAEVAPSPIQGHGLFALRAWEPGEMLCRLDGQLVDVVKYPGVVDALEWNALSPRLLLVRALRTSYGYINHATRPNVVVDADGYGMRTCRPVAAGEEFTMDYFAQPVPESYLASAEAAALRASS